MPRKFIPSEFSDLALMDIHRMFEKGKLYRHDYVITEKAAICYHHLLERVPMRHKWEIEKLLIEARIKL